MKTRISRSLIAALAAIAVTASMGVGASEAATCKVDGFKITKRKNVSCRTAKKVTHKKVSGEKLPSGWKCSSGTGIIPEGTCKKRSTNSSFKYGM